MQPVFIVTRVRQWSLHFVLTLVHSILIQLSMPAITGLDVYFTGKLTHLKS